LCWNLSLFDILLILDLGGSSKRIKYTRFLVYCWLYDYCKVMHVDNVFEVFIFSFSFFWLNFYAWRSWLFWCFFTQYFFISIESQAVSMHIRYILIYFIMHGVHTVCIRFHTSYPINSLQGGRFVLKFVAICYYLAEAEV
jgi:hypothetical protein